MAAGTKIQWADHSSSPWHGCSEVHLGCDNCYARTLSQRNPKTLGVWGDDGTRIKSRSFVTNLLKWNKEAGRAGRIDSVFPSLCDPFEDRPQLEPWRREMFDVLRDCKNIRLLLLTKRPENCRRFWPTQPVPGHVSQNEGDGRRWQMLQNAWLLASASDQTTAQHMGDNILKCRGMVPILGLSCEPLLGPIDLEPFLQYEPMTENYKMTFGTKPWRGLDWVICGCESGPKRRPMETEWAERIAHQCQEAGVAFFMKQMEVDGKVSGDIDSFPPSLRVREFPSPEASR